MQDLQAIINEAYENRYDLTPKSAQPILKEAVQHIIEELENGKIRVAVPINSNLETDIDTDPTNIETDPATPKYNPNLRQWLTNEWIKKTILLYFRLHDNQVIKGGFAQFFDKIPLRFIDSNKESLQETGIRIVPPATIRRGAYIAGNTVLMPSFINMGAYVDEGSMIDTWVTVGSCAQIGKRVHLSGGVGIGGVLEPLQAHPTIIEDDCFIGARSEIVEGVIVEKGSVISMGVYIGNSTKIYNRETGEITYGRIPSYSVVVPGNLPSADGKYSLYCAVIVKRVDDKTRQKTAINELLRL